jgi:ketosteroid isomerase-like protein
MKKLLSLMIALCVVSCSALAQTPAAKSAKSGSDQETLKQIEHDWDAADTKTDVAALDRLLASDFVQINLNGQLETKAQRLAALKSGERKFESKTINDMKVQLLGDVAIVYGLSTTKGTLQCRDMSGQFRWTDVFAKRNGRWQAVTTQSTKVVKQ